MRMRSPETHLPDLGINPTSAAHVWAHQPSEDYLRKVIADDIKKALAAGFLRPESHIAVITKGYEANLLKHNIAESSVRQIVAKRFTLLQTLNDAKENKFINKHQVQAALVDCNEELKKAIQMTKDSAKKLPGDMAISHWFNADSYGMSWEI